MNRAPLGNAHSHSSITGSKDPLLRHLQCSIAKADHMRFLVAFLMESGVPVNWTCPEGSSQAWGSDSDPYRYLSIGY